MPKMIGVEVRSGMNESVMSRSDAAALLMDMARGGYRVNSARRCSWASAPSSSGTLTA